jgi:hypothetical protein
VTRLRKSITVLAFPIAYYLVAGNGYAVFARYILPVVPFLCIAAAWFLVWTCRALAARTTPERSRLLRSGRRQPEHSGSPEGGPDVPIETTRAARPAITAVCALLVVAPTAWNSILLDRLLARTDNRLITAREVARLVTPGSSVYQTGESYGQAPTAIDDVRWPVEFVSYDAQAQRFSPKEPDWVLVHRSPLVLYSATPAGLDQILRERYAVERAFPVGDARPRLYDQQDAFYLPLAGLSGLERPGPSFELYKRRP